MNTLSPENKTSVTGVEAVSASEKVIPPVLIIQGKNIGNLGTIGIFRI